MVFFDQLLAEPGKTVKLNQESVVCKLATLDELERENELEEGGEKEA
jgi:hypothetical protein